MWWRALGVALVLLALGVLGGYAVGDRTAPVPVAGGVPEPVPAVSPAVPTPPAASLLPDPDDPPLEPGMTLEPEELRIGPRKAGVAVSVPTGWFKSREANSNTWNFTVPGAALNTYKLRVAIVVQNVSVGAAKDGRIVALRSAVDEDNLSDLQIVADTEDSLEYTYVAGDYLRYTVERWISFNGSTAFVDIAVVGRSTDVGGMRDLLARVSASAAELAPLPKDDETEAPGAG